MKNRLQQLKLLCDRLTLPQFKLGPLPQPSQKITDPAADNNTHAHVHARELPAVTPAPHRPLAPTPKLLTFLHPQALREALLGDVLVAYALKRSARKSIGFSISPLGLRVSAPNRLSLERIDRAVQEKAGWIVATLQKMHERQQSAEAVRVEWKNGSVLDFLGQPLRLLIDPNTLETTLEPLSAQLQHAPDAMQTLRLPPAVACCSEHFKKEVQNWWTAQAKLLFVARLNHYAPQLHVQWQQLRLSNAATRWGSANVNGSIRLNWRLMHFNLAVIDYVVVHELSHLRVMNHSPQFWATVGSVMPGYAVQRAELKRATLCPW